MKLNTISDLLNKWKVIQDASLHVVGPSDDEGN